MIFPTQKNVADLCVDGIAGEDHAFDEAMRVTLHQHTILKRARFHFIAIGHDILWFRRIGAHRDEAPLCAGEKPAPPLPRNPASVTSRCTSLGASPVASR